MTHIRRMISAKMFAVYLRILLSLVMWPTVSTQSSGSVLAMVTENETMYVTTPSISPTATGQVEESSQLINAASPVAGTISESPLHNHPIKESVLSPSSADSWGHTQLQPSQALTNDRTIALASTETQLLHTTLAVDKTKQLVEPTVVDTSVIITSPTLAHSLSTNSSIDPLTSAWITAQNPALTPMWQSLEESASLAQDFGNIYTSTLTDDSILSATAISIDTSPSILLQNQSHLQYSPEETIQSTSLLSIPYSSLPGTTSTVYGQSAQPAHNSVFFASHILESGLESETAWLMFNSLSSTISRDSPFSAYSWESDIDPSLTTSMPTMETPEYRSIGDVTTQSPDYQSGDVWMSHTDLYSDTIFDSQTSWWFDEMSATVIDWPQTGTSGLPASATVIDWSQTMASGLPASATVIDWPQAMTSGLPASATVMDWPQTMTSGLPASATVIDWSQTMTSGLPASATVIDWSQAMTSGLPASATVIDWTQTIGSVVDLSALPTLHTEAMDSRFPLGTISQHTGSTQLVSDIAQSTQLPIEMSSWLLPSETFAASEYTQTPLSPTASMATSSLPYESHIITSDYATSPDFSPIVTLPMDSSYAMSWGGDISHSSSLHPIVTSQTSLSDITVFMETPSLGESMATTSFQHIPVLPTKTLPPIAMSSSLPYSVILQPSFDATMETSLQGTATVEESTRHPIVSSGVIQPTSSESFGLLTTPIYDDSTENITIGTAPPDVETTPPIPSTEWMLNISDAYEDFWVKTVLQVGEEEDVSTYDFRYKMESRLAAVYNEAIERFSQILSENLLSFTRRKKRAITVGNATIQMTNITRADESDARNTALVYYLIEDYPNNITSAEQTVGYIEMFSDQELAIELGYPVIIKGETYIPAPPPEDKRLWIIGAVLGGVAGFLFLLWLSLFIYCKCTQPPKRPISPRPRNSKVSDLDLHDYRTKDVKGFDYVRTAVGMEGETDQKTHDYHNRYQAGPENERVYPPPVTIPLESTNLTPAPKAAQAPPAPPIDGLVAAMAVAEVQTKAAPRLRPKSKPKHSPSEDTVSTTVTEEHVERKKKRNKQGHRHSKAVMDSSQTTTSSREDSPGDRRKKRSQRTHRHDSTDSSTTSDHQSDTESQEKKKKTKSRNAAHKKTTKHAKSNHPQDVPPSKPQQNDVQTDKPNQKKRKKRKKINKEKPQELLELSPVKNKTRVEDPRIIKPVLSHQVHRVPFDHMESDSSDADLPGDVDPDSLSTNEKARQLVNALLDEAFSMVTPGPESNHGTSSIAPGGADSHRGTPHVPNTVNTPAVEFGPRHTPLYITPIHGSQRQPASFYNPYSAFDEASHIRPPEVAGQVRPRLETGSDVAMVTGQPLLTPPQRVPSSAARQYTNSAYAVSPDKMDPVLDPRSVYDTDSLRNPSVTFNTPVAAYRHPVPQHPVTDYRHPVPQHPVTAYSQPVTDNPIAAYQPGSIFSPSPSQNPQNPYTPSTVYDPSRDMRPGAVSSLSERHTEADRPSADSAFSPYTRPDWTESIPRAWAGAEETLLLAGRIPGSQPGRQDDKTNALDLSRYHAHNPVNRDPHDDEIDIVTDGIASGKSPMFKSIRDEIERLAIRSRDKSQIYGSSYA